MTFDAPAQAPASSVIAVCVFVGLYYRAEVQFYRNVIPESSASMNEPRANILGVGVSAITMGDALQTIQAWITTRASHFVCVTSVHGIMECQASSRLREVHGKAGLVVPDGMPVVWMAQRLGHRQTRQVYGPDLMRQLSEISARPGYRHFYYGGAPGIAELLRERMTQAIPGLQVVGTLCPPFRPMTPDEDAAAVAQINAANPDIVWVGLSTPKQELWMDEHVGALTAPVLIGVGAAFDFLSGHKQQAPRWVRKTPLQWLFRLASEPRRLWRRYVWIVPAFIWRAGLQLATARLGERR
jgi:N-acetylglucosaminyldiphosphoundecaprenol N-acetyl-beta-D-mannosaminyltransferase